MGSCAFCSTFWVGVFVLGLSYFVIGSVALPVCLFAAPVFNLILDLGVRALIKFNEPPLLANEAGIASNTASVSIPSVWIQNGESVTQSNNQNFATWKQVKDHRPSVEDCGRRIRVGLSGPIHLRNREGIIDSISYGTHIGRTDVFYIIKPDLIDKDQSFFSVSPEDCIFIEKLLPPQ